VTAGTVIARLRHRNSVHQMGGSTNNGAR